ncbi:hypothetical protein [Niallia circulans]|uniref:hypothetical protein n=1 Tax=Niallia circulans TaxID=1397 RepID=UPI00163ABA79|nr:hypothetical protein [Niallia circulans]
MAGITGSSGASSVSVEDFLSPLSVFAVARTASIVAVGCGELRPYAQESAELKRMYAKYSNAGIGSSILLF